MLTIQGIEKHHGLWRECGTVKGATHCINLPHPPSWLEAVRAMTIISILLIFATVMLGSLSMIFIKGSAAFLIATAVSALAQAVTMVIGLAIFVGKTHNRTGSLGWSFGIGWAGVGLYLSAVLTASVLAINWRHVDYAPIN